MGFGEVDDLRSIIDTSRLSSASSGGECLFAFMPFDRYDHADALALHRFRSPSARLH